MPISEQEYRDIDYVSYSLLSTMDRIGAEVKEDDFQGNKGTQMGTLIEEIVFGTYDRDKYYIGDEIAIGDTLRDVIHLIFEGEEKIEMDVRSLTLQANIYFDQNPQVGYYANWNNEKRAEKVIKDGWKYIESLSQSRGKTAFTTAEYQLCVAIANTLHTHQFTRHILKPNDPKVDSFHQFKGTFQFNGEWVKFMSDWVLVDHNQKVIYPYDLKTGNKKPENFQKSYHYWRYDVQDFLYHYGIKQMAKEHFPEYIVHPTRFIYINTVGTIKPLIYQGLGSHPIIREGYKYLGWRYKGVTELIAEYKWYKQNNFEIDFPQSVYNSDGIVSLDYSEMKSLT